MSKRQTVLVASRVLAVLFLSTALSDLTYVPERLFSLFHYSGQSSVMLGENFTTRYYDIMIAFLLLRMLAYFSAAILFWRCGPRVVSLFSPQENQAATASATAESE